MPLRRSWTRTPTSRWPARRTPRWPLAGITCVGEFHYLHHGPDGTPYDDPNAMGHALGQAAADAGIRLTLLDTCYLKGGLTPEGSPAAGAAAAPVQRLERRAVGGPRVALLEQTDPVRIGVAAHSVRAVEKIDIGRIAAMGGPMHIHVSEQPAENDACRGYYLCSPTELLEDEGALGDQVTAVHGTHLSERDRKLLGGSRTNVCFTPRRPSATWPTGSVRRPSCATRVRC